MDRNKCAAYFGFAKRARKLTIGLNATASAKRVFLLAQDSAASEGSKREIASLQKRFACPLVEVRELGELVNKPGCAVAAVRDEQLARAIAAECENGTAAGQVR